jgi:histidyl-tRNA synthetase
VSHLRRKGRAVLPDCLGGTILRQEKRAIESGARFIVTVDDKDLAWPLVRVRDLRPADGGGPTSVAKDYRDLGGEPQ